MIKFKHPPLSNLYITSEFGIRDFRGMWWHNGIDLRAVVGTPVFAVADGVVRVSKNNPTGYGLYIVVDHNKWGSLYAHLSKLLVTENTIVKAGDLIGLSGNTGNSEAAHLHFEIRLGDYFKSFWDRSKTDPNVYMRCVDPESYIDDLIEDEKRTVEEAKVMIQKATGFDSNTMDYLSKYYKFSDAVLLKLAKALY